MPIYEYQCHDCSHQFEAMRKISDAALTECPSCGTNGLQKLVSKVAFRLKGTGWYETDFKTKPADAKAETSEKSAKSEKSDKSESEAKPAKKDSATTDAKPASSSTSESTKSAPKSDD